jgi:hypothetical protein
MEENSEPGSEINIPDLFLRTWYQFFGLKILKFLDVDPGSVNPTSGMEKSDLG